MKRIAIILALSIISLTISAQRGPGSEPGLLEFKHITFVEGMSKEDLQKKADVWMESVGHLEKSPFLKYERGREKFQFVNRLHYVFAHKFRLSLDKFVPGGGDETFLDFMVDIFCKDGLYIVTIYDIASNGTPTIFKYYGEAGTLNPELYTKRQLKHSVPVLEYIMDRADEIFSQIDEYMLN